MNLKASLRRHIHRGAAARAAMSGLRIGELFMVAEEEADPLEKDGRELRAALLALHTC